MEVKNEKDFEKTIMFEHLAQTIDVTKYMLKSYIKFILTNGEKEICYLYSVGKNDANKFTSDLNFKRKCLVGLFNKIVKDGKWKVSTEEILEYDENGDLIDYRDFNEHIISSRTVIKRETEYYIEKGSKIESVDKNGNYIFRYTERCNKCEKELNYNEEILKQGLCGKCQEEKINIIRAGGVPMNIYFKR